MRRLNSAARLDSLKGGAAISQMDFCCETVQALSVFIVARIDSDCACTGVATAIARIAWTRRFNGSPGLAILNRRGRGETTTNHHRGHRGKFLRFVAFLFCSSVSSVVNQIGSSASSAVDAFSFSRLNTGERRWP